MLRSVCLYALCIAGAKHASDLTFCSWKVPLRRMRNPLLFGFSSSNSPFSAPDTMCLIWTRLKMLQGIVRILKSVSHWNQINIYKHRWSMRIMNRACELPRPHTSTRLCNCSRCVSMLCFAACSQPSLPLIEPPMELPSRWRVGGGIEAHLLLPLLRRHQSRVLSNHDTYFAVSYLDGSAYAKASENDCVALFSWVCHGFKNWFDSSVANPTHGH